MIIMTAQEMAEAKRVGLKRAMMGTDVRCHNGARSQVQRNHKKDNKRWSNKDKRDALGD